MKACPCKGCTERTGACHSTCQKYLEWKEDLQEVRKKEFETRMLERMKFSRYLNKRK